MIPYENLSDQDENSDDNQNEQVCDTWTKLNVSNVLWNFNIQWYLVQLIYMYLQDQI